MWPSHAQVTCIGKISVASHKADKANRPDAVDVIDGVPDRSANARPWKYLALVAVFVAWVVFLVLCGIIGAL